MLKRFLIAQVIIIAIEITIGSILLNQLDPNLKMIHGTIGTLVGLTSAATAYVAFREKATPLVLSLTLLTVLSAVLAYSGGKIAATNYDLGLMIMRTAAVAALALSIFCLYKVWKTQKTS